MARLDLIEITEDGIIRSGSLCRRMASFDERKAMRSDAGKKGAAMLWQSHGKRLTKDGKGEKSREDKIKKNRKSLTQEEFLADLKANIAYKHIDIDREFVKAQAWIVTHSGRKFSQGFFVRWLNKIEPEMEVNKPEPKCAF